MGWMHSTPTPVMTVGLSLQGTVNSHRLFVELGTDIDSADRVEIDGKMFTVEEPHDQGRHHPGHADGLAASDRLMAAPILTGKAAFLLRLHAAEKQALSEMGELVVERARAKAPTRKAYKEDKRQKTRRANPELIAAAIKRIKENKKLSQTQRTEALYLLRAPGIQPGSPFVGRIRSTGAESH